MKAIDSGESRTPSHSLGQIAQIVGGLLEGDSGLRVSGASGLQEAVPGQLSFIAGPKFVSLAAKSKASAFIVGSDLAGPFDRPVIRSAHPAAAFLQVLKLWSVPVRIAPPGVHPTAVVAQGVRLGDQAAIGPYAVIEEGVVIGSNTQIAAHVFVGKDSVLGSDCVLYPQVTVREKTVLGNRVILHSGVVIGSDGFGYESVEDRHIKVPQTGNVQIDDDVEIGSNSCVDRARFGTTHIKRGTKIDNLVQIAHNVVIGEDCIIVSLSGLSGSSKLDDHVIIAGQVGVVNGAHIGSRAVVGAQSGVVRDIEAGSFVLGSPPRPARLEKEIAICLSRLPDLFKEFAQLKKKLQT